jgi:hypothetical protein
MMLIETPHLPENNSMVALEALTTVFGVWVCGLRRTGADLRRELKPRPEPDILADAITINNL